MLVGAATDLLARRALRHRNVKGQTPSVALWSGEPVARRDGGRARALAPRPAALRDLAQRAQQRHADAAKPGLALVLGADHTRPEPPAPHHPRQGGPARDEAGCPGRAGDAQIAREHLGCAAPAEEYPRRRAAASV